MPKTTAPKVKSLYYITHRENLPSILERGILSHGLVEEQSIGHNSVYNGQIVGNRKERAAPDGRSLWEFANLYFQPRNPMLFRVTHERGQDEIVVLGVSSAVIERQDVFLTDGNAASQASKFFSPPDGRRALAENWTVIQREWWNKNDGSKRRIMAECLVPGSIPPDLIHSIYVANHTVAEKVKTLIAPHKQAVIPEPKMFFLPSQRRRLTDSLFLVEGDLFFSSMQTLAVSVNTVGVMGKGLASRAKYQFPDVYVVYQDVCRQKKLRMGKPYLYRREESFDDELLDEPGKVTTANGVKWFLLFATKRHWREDSDLAGIEAGLQWLADNYRHQDIQSIALPALGCGLGNLPWEDVGPLMCRYLAPLEIQVAIYLPRESAPSELSLSREFLLGKAG